MQITIQRVDKELPLPAYKTSGAVAFDLVSRVSIVVPPGEVVYAPLNVIIATPAGHMLLLAARSSLHKRGLMMANNVGLIDQDYCGANDEIVAPLFNITKQPVTIARGERIMQAAIIPITNVTWNEVDTIDTASRGGFGTTGDH